MIKHDVVVIGGGLAGMRAAVEAAERGADVAIVSKMHPVRSHSGAAQGGINAALGNREDDAPENHAFDTAKGSDYLGDQSAIEAMCEDAPHQIVWLEHRGCIFSRLPDGRIAQRPFGGHSYPRATLAADKTGFFEMQCLYDTLMRYRCFTRYDEFFLTNILVEDGRFAGLLGIHAASGETVLIQGKALL
ncbi:MAG: FAD-dependent oxidoreductase, partial [Vulcanimicrobiaceae bacterium]